MINIKTCFKRFSITVSYLLIAGNIFLMLPENSYGDWISKATINIPEPGMITAILPPELHQRSESGDNYLSLYGPDGNRRAIELYQKENPGAYSIGLDPSQITMGESKSIIWESKPFAPGRISHIDIQTTDKNFIGSVTVQGLAYNQWVTLSENAAIYMLNNAGRAVVQLPDFRQPISGIKLIFSGFDPQYTPQAIPIRLVTAAFKGSNKSDAKKQIHLDIAQSETGHYTEITAVLPGKGLFIETVTFKTDAQFIGKWAAGKNIYENGSQDFRSVKQGVVQTPEDTGQKISLDINRYWADKLMIIRLYHDETYIGNITNCSATARLLRLFFSADQTGVYTAKVSKECQTLVKPLITNSKIEKARSVGFGAPVVNPNQEIALTDQYKIKGGPLDLKAFTWYLPFTIASPGYYKLMIDPAAALKKERDLIRIGRNKTQIPFFFGNSEIMTIEPETEHQYDKKTNISNWTVTLPATSKWWQSLSLSANGYFQRQVKLMVPGPGNTGWEAFLEKTWKSNNNKPSNIRFSLNDKQQRKTYKIVVYNGDNQPLNISGITASYSIQPLFFLVHEAGEYRVYGGDTALNPAEYDLAMIKKDLQDHLPTQISTGMPVQTDNAGLTETILKQFGPDGPGLYIILVIVTLVLLAIISKMLPKKSTGN